MGELTVDGDGLLDHGQGILSPSQDSQSAGQVVQLLRFCSTRVKQCTLSGAASTFAISARRFLRRLFHVLRGIIEQGPAPIWLPKSDIGRVADGCQDHAHSF